MALHRYLFQQGPESGTRLSGNPSQALARTPRHQRPLHRPQCQLSYPQRTRTICRRACGCLKHGSLGPSATGVSRCSTRATPRRPRTVPKHYGRRSDWIKHRRHWRRPAIGRRAGAFCPSARYLARRTIPWPECQHPHYKQDDRAGRNSPERAGISRLGQNHSYSWLCCAERPRV